MVQVEAAGEGEAKRQMGMHTFGFDSSGEDLIQM